MLVAITMPCRGTEEHLVKSIIIPMIDDKQGRIQIIFIRGIIIHFM